MIERRTSALIAAVLVLLASAVLWNLFVRPAPRARSPATPESQVESVAATPAPGAADTAVRPAPTRQAGPPPLPLAPPPLDGGSNGTSYMVLLARSETRRPIRASAGLTYLTDIVAESQDSMLHRWDNRIQNPVRVYVAPGRVANYRPGFVDAIHRGSGGGRTPASPCGSTWTPIRRPPRYAFNGASSSRGSAPAKPSCSGTRTAG